MKVTNEKVSICKVTNSKTGTGCGKVTSAKRPTNDERWRNDFSGI